MTRSRKVIHLKAGMLWWLYMLHFKADNVSPVRPKNSCRLLEGAIIGALYLPLHILLMIRIRWHWLMWITLICMVTSLDGKWMNYHPFIGLVFGAMLMGYSIFLFWQLIFQIKAALRGTKAYLILKNLFCWGPIFMFYAMIIGAIVCSIHGEIEPFPFVFMWPVLVKLTLAA
jgi:hypothetical protein